MRDIKYSVDQTLAQINTTSYPFNPDQSCIITTAQDNMFDTMKFIQILQTEIKELKNNDNGTFNPCNNNDGRQARIDMSKYFWTHGIY